MIEDPDRSGYDLSVPAEWPGTPPFAPLAMPKQRLERRPADGRGLLQRMILLRGPQDPAADLGRSGG
jgi:hypothetical protein